MENKDKNTLEKLQEQLEDTSDVLKDTLSKEFVEGLQPVVLEKCNFCQVEVLAEQLVRRSYYVDIAKIGRITSQQPMCDKCFELIKNNQFTK